jgi:hypothetical protein
VGSNVRSGITWHNGETGGYHAFIGFNRQAHEGVVVLSNVADMQIDQLGVHVLAPYIPAPAPITASAKQPSPYAGVYRLSEAFAITIYKTGGKLYAQGTGQHALELSPAAPHQFTVNGVDAQITFQVDDRGNATGLTLHQNGVDQQAERTP